MALTVVELPAEFANFEFLTDIEIQPVDSVSRGQFSPFSGKIVTDEVDFGGGWFEVSLQTVPLTYSESASLFATLVRSARAQHVLQLPLFPTLIPSNSPSTTTLTVTTEAMAGVNSVSLSGLSSGQVLPAGTWLSTTAGKTLHITQTRVTANIFGIVTVSIFPRIVTTLSVGTTVKINSGVLSLWKPLKIPALRMRAPGALNSYPIELRSVL